MIAVEVNVQVGAEIGIETKILVGVTIGLRVVCLVWGLETTQCIQAMWLHSQHRRQSGG